MAIPLKKVNFNDIGIKLILDPDDAEYYLYFNYGIDEGGFYQSYATVTDEDGLNDLIGDDVDEADEILPDELTPEDQLTVEPQ